MLTDNSAATAIGDNENTFAFAFATTPGDSRGAAHIIEHSVLCGSTRYPLKDAFITLLQGSLNTYMNAWTFPDKTVYPAASTNTNDYFNLFSVYADAVFRPKLAKWTFLQEGWRYENNSVTGVVYNEMRGAYSQPDEYAGEWSTASVLPDTPYAFDSGGNPDQIPNLSYDDFVAFHKTHYCPANCRIFLCGNIPTETQLAFIDEQISGLPAGQPVPPVPLQPRWDKPKTIVVPAPSGAPDDDNLSPPLAGGAGGGGYPTKPKSSSPGSATPSPPTTAPTSSPGTPSSKSSSATTAPPSPAPSSNHTWAKT
jgi:Zn-dependent M16 (insulinase) family peptidase